LLVDLASVSQAFRVAYLQVDHGRLDVSVSNPILDRQNVGAFTYKVRCQGVFQDVFVTELRRESCLASIPTEKDIDHAAADTGTLLTLSAGGEFE